MTFPLEVVLDVATSSDAGLLANLLELYVHDLSEVFPEMRRNSVRAGGRPAHLARVFF